MKKYYPHIYSKMIWAYTQITNHLDGVIKAKEFMDEIKKFASLAMQVYRNDVKLANNVQTTDDVYITKRLVKVINEYFLKCLKASPVNDDNFKQCKKLINTYIRDKLINFKSERI